MNEIDIYMKLIDNEEADRILKMFNINIKTNDLNLKKIYILKIFRGQVNNRKKRNNPFYTAIAEHQNPKLKDMYSSEEEFFELLNKMANDEFPSYKKFANALLYYPDKTKEILPLIEENIINDRPILHTNNRLDTIEECKEYFINISEVNKNNFIDEYIKSEYNKQLTECCDDVVNWDIKDLYNNIYNANKKNEKKMRGYILKYAYLKRHPNEEVKIRESLFMQILLEILHEQKLKINYFIKETSNPRNEFKDKEYKNEITLLKKKNNKICKENDNLKKEYKKRIEKLKKENKALNYINDEFKKENKIFVDKYKELETEFDAQKKQNNTDIKILKDEKQKILTKIKELDFYNEVVFSGNNQDKLFAVIYSMNIYVCKKIFQEIIFISKNELRESLNDICEKKIGYVYIQRNGISSKVIAEIESFCLNNNIQSKVFIAKNEKELIETISSIKNKIRSGV